MNPVHVHLLLNHVSIMAALFSVLIFLYGLLRKNQTAKNIAMTGFVLAALAGIPVFLTGEPAEEAVEHLAGVSETAIEAHEEAGELAVWLIGVTGALSLAGLLLRNAKFFATPAFSIILALSSIASAASAAYTGYLGGQVRHTEIAGGAATAGGEQQAEPAAGAQENEEDDD